MGAMLARHLPLVWTFAGGCLSGAALIALWPGETETVSSPRKQPVTRSSGTISPSSATPNAVGERALPNDAPDAIPDDAPDARAEPGSSVANVLVRLEAAYRQGLPATAPVNAPSSAERELTTTARTEALPAEVPAPVPARAEPAVAVASPAPVAAPAPTTAPQVHADTHPATAPEAERVSVLAARDDTQPRNVNVHVGDNHQSTHVGDVYEGNVVLVQQAPVYGYPQLLAPPRGRVAPSPHAGVGYSQYPTHGTTPRRTPTFASSWTVPNDRLGYDSALVPMLEIAERLGVTTGTFTRLCAQRRRSSGFFSDTSPFPRSRSPLSRYRR